MGLISRVSSRTYRYYTMGDIIENDGFYKISINHCGGKNYDIAFDKTATGEDLVVWVENALQVPRYQIKIIFRGKLILEDSGSFKSIGIPQVGGKFMLIGKTNKPEEEKAMKEIIEIVKQSEKYENEVQERSVQYDKSIRQNHVDVKDQPKVIDQIRKRLKFCAEQQYKLLEKLDCMGLKKEMEEAKRMRKSAIMKIQKWLDNTDKVIEAIESVKND